MLNKALFALAILIGTALLVFGAALAYAPTLFSGPWYEITFTSAEFKPDGMLEFHYNDRLSYGAAVRWRNADPSEELVVEVSTEDSWSQREGGFLRWPRTLKDLSSRSLHATEKGPKQGTLLITPGTYRLRPGERLVYFRAIGRKGAAEELLIEARAE